MAKSAGWMLETFERGPSIRQSLFIVVTLALLCGACGDDIAARRRNGDVYRVTAIDLIAHPKAFHGRYVQLVGFLHLEFEGDAIYLSREAYEAGQYGLGSWVEFSEKAGNANKFNGRYVLVQGTFDADHKGHMGLSSGTIDKIDRILPWQDEKPVAKATPPGPSTEQATPSTSGDLEE